ncbi:MAG TPA: hypothetical protein VJ954_04455 [Ignavibacteriaceae bacterium]|nr:hypothetical protein [Ignavibacteriaceae bacterium]
MIKKKSLIGYSVFIIVVILLFLISNYSSVNNCIKANQELSFNGHVIRKYIDKKNHENLILEIMDQGSKIKKIDLSVDHSGLYKYVQANDSIVKYFGSLKIMLYRNSTDTTFLFDRKCIGF